MRSTSANSTARQRIVLTGWFVIVAGGLIAASLAYVALYRATGAPVLKAERSVAVETRAIRFEDRADGTLAIYDAAAKQPFEIIAPEKSGFIRGTTRALQHGRRVNRAGTDVPFELVRWADGRFSLIDKADAREIPLEAFGATNAAEFARLLTLGRSPSPRAALDTGGVP